MKIERDRIVDAKRHAEAVAALQIAALAKVAAEEVKAVQRRVKAAVLSANRKIEHVCLETLAIAKVRDRA